MIYTLFFIVDGGWVNIPTWLGVYTSLDNACDFALKRELLDPDSEGYYSIMESELDNPMSAKRVLRIPEET